MGEIKTISRSLMNSYSFDLEVNKALSDGYKLKKLYITNKNMLVAILIKSNNNHGR